jgi:hypothetical protein
MTSSSSPESSPSSISFANRATDRICILVLLVLTLAVYSPALFGGRVLLPADIIPLMRPWAATAREKFPDYRFAQNQMHGPIFEYYSWRHYARERLHAGEVPLWNPYELGGNVLLANSQSAVLYPPNILLYVFPLHIGINLVTALHTFLTGCFLFFLMRRLKLGPPAALTAALVWMFCGLQLAWTEFQTPTAVLCWLPAVLLAWERYAQDDDWRWGVFGAGSVIGLILLAGHLHFAFYTILAFVLYAVWCSLVKGSPSKLPKIRTAIILAGAMAFGITLSAATMVPVVEMARMNFRGVQDSYAGSIGLRLPPKNLLTLLLPNLYGNPRDYVSFDSNGQATGGNPYFGGFDFIEYTAYLGIPALLLAVAGLYKFAGRADRSVLFFALLALVGLFLALGTPFCAVFFYGVPGYRQFNATARALCLFSFGMAALAGYGVQAIVDSVSSEEKKRTGKVMGWTAGLLFLLGLVAFPGMALVENAPDPQGRIVARLFTDQWFGYELGNLRHFAIFWGLSCLTAWLALRNSEKATYSIWKIPVIWAIPAVAVLDLIVWGYGFNPATNPGMLEYPTQTTDYLKDKAPDRVVSLEAPGKGIKSFIVPNYNSVVHLRDVQGADSLHTRRLHKLLEGVVIASEPGRTSAFSDPNTLHVPNVNHPFFNLMNARYLTTDAEVQLPAPFKKVEDTELAIWENPNAFGAAWIAGGNVIQVSDWQEALSKMGDASLDLKRTVLVDKPLTEQIGAATGTAVVTSFSPHRISYSVDSSDSGLMVASEVYFPGWKATVDGAPSPVINADWVLRATPITKGKHEVVFTYEPVSYRVGLYLTVLSAGVFAGFLACKRRSV